MCVRMNTCSEGLSGAKIFRKPTQSPRSFGKLQHWEQRSGNACRVGGDGEEETSLLHLLCKTVLRNQEKQLLHP